MKGVFLKLTSLFILLVFLQIWLFEKIHLFGFASPLLYIYFIIKLPVNMNRNAVLLLSALLGFILDVFNGALGLCMTVTVFVGFLRYYLLKLFVPRDIFENYIPSFSTFGKILFLRYAGVMTMVHVLLLYYIETLSLLNIGLLFLHVTGSFILTFLLIFAFESINPEVFKK